MLGVNIGLDFGSSSTIIAVEGKGIVLDEPSIIAVDAESKYPVAFGNSAYNVLGRTDEFTDVIRPVVNGVISNYTYAKKLLTYYFQKICGNMVFKPNVIITVPSSATNLDRRTFLDVLTASGAGKVCLVEESLASAIGAGIKENSFSGKMLINLGGGSADISVITRGSISVADTIKIGGISLDEEIQKYLKKTRDILIGPLTAERLKICLGSAVRREEELTLVASGKSGLDNMPISFEITSDEIYECMHEQIMLIIDGIKSVLEKTPPELVGDISDNGIILTGGTALLLGIDKLIEQETGIHTKLTKDPMNNTINGVTDIIKNFDLLSEGYAFNTIHQLIS
ncbi:MAG TPA: rod shape-determining protein [Ruminococcaceae bacterium]|nr:rod shape-determining protein [Oscillospiraceae bacterium]